MNWNRVEGNWDQLKSRVQERWGKLTGDDLDRIAGNRRRLVGKLQEQDGKAEEQIEQEINDWLKRH